jgi:hypothetical protein
MRPEQRRQALLVIVTAALAVVVYIEWPRAVRSSPAVSSATRATGKPAAGAAGDVGGTDVHLEALEAARTSPGDIERNLFKFKTKVAPAPPPPVPRPVVMPPVSEMPTGPPPPPPLPPIGLRFIGILETGNAQKIAVLSDGRGGPLYGKEGDTVLGQYKILRIGVESIEMAYLDGRGRQTIRLSGS